MQFSRESSMELASGARHIGPMKIEPVRRFVAVLTMSSMAFALQGCNPLDAFGGGVGEPGTTTTTTSVEPGTTSPVREISLDAMSWADGLRLAINVSLMAPVGGADIPAQRLVLDTGSSTLAFCDTNLAQQVQSLRTNYVSCNMYNPGGAETGYWGYFYNGPVNVGQVLRIDATDYSIMQKEESMPCTDGFQGIFGIAFAQLDSAYNGDDSQALVAGQTASCPSRACADLEPPLLKSLRGASGVRAFGIFWSGSQGLSEGSLHIGEDAITNKHYTTGKMLGQAALGELGWYDISIEQIALSSTSQAWDRIECKAASQKCILDTGSPSLLVPQKVFTAINKLYNANRPLGSISFTLAGWQGGPSVVLQFSLATLVEQQWIQAGDDKTGIVLGLPLWSMYYTVMNIDTMSVTFVSNVGDEMQPTDAPTTTTPGWALQTTSAPTTGWWPIFEEEESNATRGGSNTTSGNVSVVQGQKRQLHETADVWV